MFTLTRDKFLTHVVPDENLKGSKYVFNQMHNTVLLSRKEVHFQQCVDV